jgi:hypothetical protein
VDATAHDGLPASQSLLARAHIFATYLPGMAHVVASQESCRNPQVEVIQTLPSQTICSPSTFRIRGNVQSRGHPLKTQSEQSGSLQPAANATSSLRTLVMESQLTLAHP